MNFWKNPEYNSIKALIIAVILVLAAFFVYKGMHQNALENAGRVTPLALGVPMHTGLPSGGGGGGGAAGTTGTGATTGTTSGGGTSDVPHPCDRSSMGSEPLLPSADNATFPATGLHFDKNGQDGGHFIIQNMSTCPMKVRAIKFSLVSTYPALPAWQPIGGVADPATGLGDLKLHVGTATTAGALFNTPTGPLFGSPLMSPSSDPLRSLTFMMPAGSGVVIPPMSSQSFALEVNSWNTNPMDPATTSTIGTVNFKLQAIAAQNMTTLTPYAWTLPTSGVAPASVTSSTMTIVNP